MKFDNGIRRKVKVSDLGRIVTGKTPKTSNPVYYGGDIPFLTPSDDMSAKYVVETKRTLTTEGRQSVKNMCLPADSVCVSCIGSDLGKVVVTTEETITNQQINSIIVDKTNYDVDFVYYAMSILGKKINYISKTSTAVPIVNKTSFSNFTIDCPDLHEQKKISQILAVFDDKINNNNAINKKLEEQAHLIYQEFSSHADTWIDGTVGDVVTLQRGYDLPKTNMIPGKYPVAGSTDTIFYHNQYMSNAPCIVLGRSGNIGKPRLYFEPCWPHNTSLFTKQFKNSNPLWVYFMLYHLDYSMFQGGSAVPTLNRNHIHSYTIKIPPITEQNKFAQTIEPLIKATFHNTKEIENLSKLRDTLLPRLMSGEIDVSCVS